MWPIINTFRQISDDLGHLTNAHLSLRLLKMRTGTVIATVGKFLSIWEIWDWNFLLEYFFSVLLHLSCTLKLHQGHPECADNESLSSPNTKKWITEICCYLEQMFLYYHYKLIELEPLKLINVNKNATEIMNLSIKMKYTDKHSLGAF